MAWKSFLAIFFSLFLFLHIGCTSSDSGEDAETDVEMAEDGDLEDEDYADEDGEEFDEEGDEELADLEDEEGEELSDLEEEGSEESSEGEDFAFDEDTDGNGAEVDDEAGDDSLFAQSEDGGTEDVFADESTSNAEGEFEFGDEFEDAGAPAPEVAATEEIADGDYAANEESAEVAPASTEPLPEVAKPTWIPVKKIKTQTYQRAGALVNAVYIGRPGDTVASISQKIYGDDRSRELLSINPHLSRGVDPGDKLYYNSPSRPQDTSQILTYAEDMGIQPSFYQTQRGDNIREVTKNLMGYEGAWKEVWATNPDLGNDEKWGVKSGRNIRYWPNLESAQQPPQLAQQPAESEYNELAVAQNSQTELPAEPEPAFEEPISEPDPFAEMPAEQAIAEELNEPTEGLSEGLPEDDPFADLPEVSDEDFAALDAPPPASQEDMSSTAPRVATAAKKTGNDMIMMVGAAALILIGLGGLVVARRKRLASAQGDGIEVYDMDEMEKTEVG